MPAFFAFATLHGPLIMNGTAFVSKSASWFVSSTFVERIFFLPSSASTSPPLTESGVLTMTLLGS